MLNMVRDQKFPPCLEVDREVELIKREVRAVMNKVLELGNGDIAIGTVRAFEAGVLDVPFAPATCNSGKCCRSATTTARSAYSIQALCRCLKMS